MKYIQMLIDALSEHFTVPLHFIINKWFMGLVTGLAIGLLVWGGK